MVLRKFDEVNDGEALRKQQASHVGEVHIGAQIRPGQGLSKLVHLIRGAHEDIVEAVASQKGSVKGHPESNVIRDWHPAALGVLLLFGHSKGDGIAWPGLWAKVPHCVDLDFIVGELVRKFQGNTILLFLVFLKRHVGRSAIGEDLHWDVISLHVLLARPSDMENEVIDIRWVAVENIYAS